MEETKEQINNRTTQSNTQQERVKGDKNNMKKLALVLATIIIALFVIGGRALPAGEVEATSNDLYAKSMIVTDIIDDEIICVDAEGEEWSFNTEYQYNVGATIICLMDAVGTESIYDDVIMYVTYKGQLISC